MRHVSVIGSGHVGLVAGACLAELGNTVVYMDDDVKKIESPNKGVTLFCEQELEAMVHPNVHKDRETEFYRLIVKPAVACGAMRGVRYTCSVGDARNPMTKVAQMGT